MSKTAASMLGFFSIRIAIASVCGILLDMPTGTTAPFSAMSGVEKNVMSLLGSGALPPSAFIVSSSECVSNALLFHASAAAAFVGRAQPAAATSVANDSALPALSACLRFVFIRDPCIDAAREGGHCKQDGRTGAVAVHAADQNGRER